MSELNSSQTVPEKGDIRVSSFVLPSLKEENCFERRRPTDRLYFPMTLLVLPISLLRLLHAFVLLYLHCTLLVWLKEETGHLNASGFTRPLCIQLSIYQAQSRPQNPFSLYSIRRPKRQRNTKTVSPHAST